MLNASITRIHGRQAFVDFLYKVVSSLIVVSSALFVWSNLVGWPAARAELTAVNRGLRIEYPVPNNPLNLAVESPGRIWFTAPEGDAIGRLAVISEPEDPVIRYTIEYTVLEPGSEPFDLVFADGIVWFTERAGNRLGRIDVTTGKLTEYPIPTPNSAPTGIDVAPDGVVWFTERDGVKLAEFRPALGSFVERPIPLKLFLGGETSTRDLVVQNEDLIWFTAPKADAVLAYQISVDDFFRIGTGAHSEPNQLTIDQSGVPWVTAYQGHRIGRYAPGTLALWNWFDVRAGSAPAGIAFRRQGGMWELWFSANGAGQVGRLRIHPNGKSPSLSELPLTTSISAPWDIVTAADDSIWIAENGRSTVTELRPPYAYQAFMPAIERKP
jgi:virginiamycin B lyase